MTLDRLSLFRRYHANMAVRRGWPEREKTDESYWQTFVEGAGAFGREFLYFEQGRLIAVGLADVLPSSLSSVYFFHDPELRNRGLGIFSILTQMRFAQNHGLEAQYLGYWVEECQSMAYKRQFRPHQILQGRPGDLEDPIWLNSDPETE
jgi:arginine-tRNA-protein transferase